MKTIKLPEYWKSVIALTGAVVLAVGKVTVDNEISPAEWVEIIVPFLVAGGVWRAPNRPG